MRDVTVLMMMFDLWAYRFRNRKHQFAAHLARQEWVREVIFCEPPLPDWVETVDGRARWGALDAEFCGGFRDRCEALLAGEAIAGGRLIQAGPKLQVFAPNGVGCPEPRSPLWRCYGPGDVDRSVRAVQSLLAERRAGDVLLWMHSPFVPEVMDSLLYRWLVYDSTDDFSQFTNDPGDRERAMDGDLRIAARADLNLTVSSRLTRSKTLVSEQVVHLPNGCDFQHFARAANPRTVCPEEVARLSGPVFGYFGRADLHRKLDYPLLMFLALRHPEWQFVLIGPPKPEQSELRLPNIHFLGHQSYERLPEFAAAFDVCLVPHRVNALTDSMDPIKIYEYLATGKPIISTRVAGVERFAEQVAICDTWAEFERQAENALQCPHSAVEARQRIAREQSWDARFVTLDTVLRQYCSERRLGSAAAAA